MSGFVRTTWHDSSAPDIEERELNRIEQGIVDVHDQLDDRVAQVADARGRIVAALSAFHRHLGRFDNPDRVTGAMVGADALDAAIALHGADLANPHRTTARQIGLGGGVIDVSTRGISPNNSGTQNSTILQAILDEHAQYGGGEVYFPFSSGTVILIESVWIPANVRIYGSCTLRKTREGYFTARALSWDGKALPPNAMLCVRKQDIPSRPKPDGVRIEGLTVQGAEGYVPCIYLGGCTDAVLDGVKITRIPDAPGEPRSWLDCLVINDCEGVTVKNSTFEYGGRNNISVIGGKTVTIDNVTARYCQAQKGDGLDLDVSPGCGIEVEPDKRDQWSTDITISNCTIEDNAGAGVGFNFTPPHESSVLDGHATGLTIKNSSIRRNGRKPFMGNPGEAAGMTGGVYITGGESSGHGRLTISDNSIRDQVLGAGLQVMDSRTEIAATDNDLGANQGGPWTSSAYLTVNSGNDT